MADEDRLLDSNYDGIEEFDNDLPKWWRNLFYLTIFFAIGYPIYYHVTPGVDPHAQLAAELKQLEAKHSAGHTAGLPNEVSESVLLTLAAQDAVRQKGKSIYALRCVACHGANGEGIIGPNLTDNYWLHGGKITDIVNTVTNGVPEKGMVPWKGALSNEEIQAVVGYVWSLRGTNPPNGKAPQGDPVP